MANTREYFYVRFETGKIPTQEQYADLFDNVIFGLDAESELPVATEMREKHRYFIPNVGIKECKNVDNVWSWVLVTPVGSGGGTTNYLELDNKPLINGVVVSGNLSSDNLAVMPSFKALKMIQELSDDIVVCVGRLDGQPCYMYITDLARWLARYMEHTAIVKEELTITGVQDGENLDFTVSDEYYSGTSELYLNGQLMYLNRDYEEKEGGFVFIVDNYEAPVAEDRLLFKAIKKF